jgi:hypothetical protein
VYAPTEQWSALNVEFRVSLCRGQLIPFGLVFMHGIADLVQCLCSLEFAIEPGGHPIGPLDPLAANLEDEQGEVFDDCDSVFLRGNNNDVAVGIQFNDESDPVHEIHHVVRRPIVNEVSAALLQCDDNAVFFCLLR